MRTTKRPIRSAAAVAVAASLMLGTAACGSDGDASASADNVKTTTTMEMGSESTSTEVASNSPASALRATLTAGLTEHVYLTGAAVYAAVNNPDDFENATAALDENTVALSEAIVSVYGEEAGDGFLTLWRDHIGMFVDYTNAKAAGDDAAAQAAKDELATYGTDFGDFIEGANPALPSAALRARRAVSRSRWSQGPPGGSTSGAARRFLPSRLRGPRGAAHTPATLGAPFPEPERRRPGRLRNPTRRPWDAPPRLPHPTATHVPGDAAHSFAGPGHGAGRLPRRGNRPAGRRRAAPSSGGLSAGRWGPPSRGTPCPRGRPGRPSP